TGIRIETRAGRGKTADGGRRTADGDSATGAVPSVVCRPPSAVCRPPSISSPALYYTDPRARSEVRPDHAQQHVKRKCPHQHGEGQRPKPRRPAPEPSQPAAREGNGDRSQRRKEI